MNWREEAIALGWSAADLKAFETLLHSAHYTAAVQRVTLHVIHWRSVSLLMIEGIGRDGQIYTHHVRSERDREWTRYPGFRAAVTHTDIEALDWCPVHGWKCARTAQGCTPNPMVSLEIDPSDRTPVPRTGAVQQPMPKPRARGKAPSGQLSF